MIWVLSGTGELSLEVQTDSSAALAICQRRGCGRIRHLEAGCLWIQAALSSKRVNQLTKVPGAKNTADILTKSVSLTRSGQASAGNATGDPKRQSCRGTTGDSG